MRAVIGVDLAMAALTLLAAALLPVRRSAAARPIAIICLACVAWTAGVLWDELDNGVTRPANAVILAAVSVASAAAFVGARRLTTGPWRIPLALWAAFALEPAMIIVARTEAHAELSSAEFRTTWAFMAHAAYCFALLLGVILTLNARQRDPSRRVRIFVLAAQVLVISIIALEVSGYEETHRVGMIVALFSAWVARRPRDWSTSPVRTDSLLNSIGVFLFVFDDSGHLKDWNGTAERLIRLITGREPSSAMTSFDIIGGPLTFPDGERIDLELMGGRMRTTAHIHQVDPLARPDKREWIVMLRPIQSTVDEGTFPPISGELVGHDPATQTLSRRGSIDLLRQVAESGTAVVRVDVVPTTSAARDDETMFVVARRLETLFPTTRWGRMSTWAFVAEFEPLKAQLAKRVIDQETLVALGLDVTVAVTVWEPAPNESGTDFVHRVTRRRSSTR